MKSKKIVIYSLTSVFFLSGLGSLQTAPIYASSPPITITAPDSVLSSRVAKTEWRYRVVDGKTQKRLWSLSDGKWLTKWQPA